MYKNNLEKKKKKMIMIDCWSLCDKDGKPIGHGVKVGNEYYKYLNKDFEVIQYVNEEMLQYLENEDKKTFYHSLNEDSGKIKRLITFFKDMKYIYHKYPNGKIWIYLQNIYLILFIMLFPKGKRKLAITIYEIYSTDKIKQKILIYALKKLDLIFVTNPHLKSFIPQSILVPDYTYDPDQYEKYEQYPKLERVVCLGTMSDHKQIEEAIKVFSKNGYPLYIAGQFSSEKRFRELHKIKGKNVVIENRYLDCDEYYQLMGSSKYSLIPYDAGFYENRTSGVIQESIFMNAIPITCHEILKFNHIEGIGYDKIVELETMDLEKIESWSYIKSYEQKRQDFYDYQVVSKKINEAFEKKFFA